MKENETIDKFQRGKFKSLKKNGIKPNSIGGFDLFKGGTSVFMPLSD